LKSEKYIKYVFSNAARAPSSHQILAMPPLQIKLTKEQNLCLLYLLSIVFLKADAVTATGEVGVSGGVEASRLVDNFSSSLSLSPPLSLRSSGRPDMTSPEVNSSRDVTRKSTAPPLLRRVSPAVVFMVETIIVLSCYSIVCVFVIGVPAGDVPLTGPR